MESPSSIPQTFSNLLSFFHSAEEEEEFYDEYSSQLSPSVSKKNNLLFREYKKEGQHFTATQQYYTYEPEQNEFIDLYSHQHDEMKIYYCPIQKIYYCLNEEEEREYIDLYVIQKIHFTQQDFKLTRQEIIMKMSMNDIEIDEKLIKDFYFDISYQLSNQQNENKKMQKRYLFAYQTQSIASPQQCSIY
jgi:hypothetical protein